MIWLHTLTLAGILGAAPAPAAGQTPAIQGAAATLTGIPLDAPWKRTVYAFARQKLLHPAWGWTHSERDYQLARRIAAKEGLRIDTDVLFAAAFTHDIGAVGEFQEKGVDHAVQSVKLAKPLLLNAGFPAAKWPAVQEAILGHMYDKDVGSRAESLVLHDADALDFLGSVGVARRLAVTGTSDSYLGGLTKIREFADLLPGRLTTRSARRMAPSRVREMRRFLEQLATETAGARLP